MHGRAADAFDVSRAAAASAGHSIRKTLYMTLRTLPRALLLPLTVSLTGLLAACGGGGSTESPPPPTAGLYAAAQLFKDSPQSGATNVILLFTDGENHSSPEDLAIAMEAVKKANATLFIVGLGSTKPSYIPVYGGDDKPKFEADGTRPFHKFNDGTVAQTARNDSFLQQLAADTGGRYVVSESGQRLNISWPSSLAGTKVEIAKRYWYGPFIGAAMVILAIIWLVGPVVSGVSASAAARNAKQSRG